jgi:hypothetical protein
MRKYYLIIESCMRPNGAYSKSIAKFDHRHRASAHNVFTLAQFTGPGTGILSNKAVQLVWVDRSVADPSAWVWNIIATKRFE